MTRATHYVRTVFAFVVFAVGGAILSWIVLPVAWALTPGRERATRRCQSILQGAFRLFITILAGLRLYRSAWPIRESRRLPRPSVVLCNHPCLLDTVAMVARYDHVVCLVKQSYYDSPFFHGLARFCGYVPAGGQSVRGHRRMLAEAIDRLERGYSVLAFPECRRTPLHGRLPFRRGPVEIAAVAEVPIVPVRLRVEPRILTREEPIHRMPTRCGVCSAEELEPQWVEPGRLRTKAATEALQSLLQGPERIQERNIQSTQSSVAI